MLYRQHKILTILCVRAVMSDSATPWTSQPDSSFYGILQARILEWVAFPSPGHLPDPGVKSRSPALQAGSLQSESPGKPHSFIN